MDQNLGRGVDEESCWLLYPIFNRWHFQSWIHGFEFLPKHFDEFMAILEILISLFQQILNKNPCTSTIPICSVILIGLALLLLKRVSMYDMIILAQ